MTTTYKTPEPGRDGTKGGFLPQKLQLELAAKMLDTLDFVLSGRSTYYRENPDKVPSPVAVPSLITSYARTNMAVSGGISLIPGPWGMAAAIPEVAILTRNQLAMIYDIGMAHGKSNVLNKELLAGVFLAAMGTSTGGLLVMHGGKVLVRRAALRVFQRVIMLLAGKVTQQMLKSMVSKWLPFVGAVAMATWSNYITRQIGEKAVDILAKPIDIAEGVEGEMTDENAEGGIAPDLPGGAAMTTMIGLIYPVEKIKALINLMNADKKMAPEESTYIQTLIEHGEMDDETRIELAALLDQEEKGHVDFALFAKEPDEVAGMLVDLVALAKRDGVVRLAERLYIKQACKLMGLSESRIEEAMT